MYGRAIGVGGLQVPRLARVNVPRVDRRAVLCPDCKAEVGSPCTTLSTGAVMANGHRSRIRMATRKLLEDRCQANDAEGVAHSADSE